MDVWSVKTEELSLTPLKLVVSQFQNALGVIKFIGS